MIATIFIKSKNVFGQTNKTPTWNQKQARSNIALSENQKHNVDILNTIISRIVPNEQIEDQGDSKDTRGADSRGLCADRIENFIALAPNTFSYDFESLEDKEAYLQKTLSKIPSIYFYTSVKSPLKAQFSIMNMKGEELETFPVKVPIKSGFFQVSFFPHFSLKTSKKYVWKLNLYREGDLITDNSSFMAIIGSIQYTKLENSSYFDSTNASLLNIGHTYFHQRYWYEAINTLHTSSKNEQDYKIIKMLKKLGIYSCFFAELN